MAFTRSNPIETEAASRWPPAAGWQRPSREGCCRDGQNETVPSFASYDGTEIGYRVLGDGPPLVCLPGGPGRAAD